MPHRDTGDIGRHELSGQREGCPSREGGKNSSFHGFQRYQIRTAAARPGERDMGKLRLLLAQSIDGFDGGGTARGDERSDAPDYNQ